MSTLDGDDERYLNGLVDGLQAYVAKEIKEVHGRINKVEDCANCSKRKIAILEERSRWTKWGLVTILGGLIVTAIGLIATAARGML